MTGFSPANFTVSGSGFTPGGSVAINVLNSSGNIVGTTNTTADSNGDINDTVASSILAIGPNTAGTYYGSVEAVDSTTGIKSNAVNVTLTVTMPTPQITLSTTSFTYVG